jgi:hypothetical protein
MSSEQKLLESSAGAWRKGLGYEIPYINLEQIFPCAPTKLKHEIAPPIP